MRARIWREDVDSRCRACEVGKWELARVTVCAEVPWRWVVRARCSLKCLKEFVLYYARLGTCVRGEGRFAFVEVSVVHERRQGSRACDDAHGARKGVLRRGVTWRGVVSRGATLRAGGSVAC